MKYVFIFIILKLFCQLAPAQEASLLFTKNVIYLEFLGVAEYGSLNYERIVFNKKKLGLGLRLGVSTNHIKDYTTAINPDIIIPFSINGYYGNKHKAEIGFGQVISNIVQANSTTWKPERITKLNANFAIGYRFQKHEKGLFFRCTYTPIIEFYKYFRHRGGFSIGYSF